MTDRARDISLVGGLTEIVDGSRSGGSNTSHTIVFPALRSLLDAVPSAASFEDHEQAVLVDNELHRNCFPGSQENNMTQLKRGHSISR